MGGEIQIQKFFYFHFRNPNIRKLFKAWNDILRWYEKDKEDILYWYLERTNIGHLALAAYQLKGYPLQEFSMKKVKGTQKSTGRADLFMYFPKGTLSDAQWYDFNIEAKQIWCSISIGNDQKEMIGKALKKADVDLKKHRDKTSQAKYGMAILFVLPYMKMLDEKKDMKKQLLSKFNKQIKQTAEEMEASFAAVHYADIEVSTELSQKYTKPDWYPGIAVIGKITNKK